MLPTDIEASVRAQALDLLQCGLRPAVIRLLCGGALSITDYHYLYKCFSPLPQERRQGRLRFNPENGALPRAKNQQLQSMDPDAIAMLIEGLEYADEALMVGASKADSLAAAWRMVVGARGYQPIDLIHGLGGEDLATLWLNHQAGEVLVCTCVSCFTKHLQLAPAVPKCLGCLGGTRKKRKVA